MYKSVVVRAPVDGRSGDWGGLAGGDGPVFLGGGP